MEEMYLSIAIFSVIIAQTLISFYLMIWLAPFKKILKFLNSSYFPLKTLFSTANEIVQVRCLLKIQAQLLILIFFMGGLFVAVLAPFIPIYFFYETKLGFVYMSYFLDWRVQILVLAIITIIFLRLRLSLGNAKSCEQYSSVAKLFILIGWLTIRKQLVKPEARAANNKKESKLPKILLVTGLARAGTTIVHLNIANHKSVTCLRYSDLPFLFNSYWNKKFRWLLKYQTQFEKRVHDDGILINSDSAEALDEMIYSRIDSSIYIKQGHLAPNSTEEARKAFIEFGQNHAINRGSKFYATKNNNHILRIKEFINQPNLITLLILRHPIAHAESLLKVHQILCDNLDGKKNGFEIEFMSLLGHFEFGPNHKPFLLDEHERPPDFEKKDLNYWLVRWIEYYQYVLKNDLVGPNVHLICYENMVTNPNAFEGVMSKLIDEDFQLSEKLLSDNRVNCA